VRKYRFRERTKTAWEQPRRRQIKMNFKRPWFSRLLSK
jgi:hypothetical protein